MEVIRLLAKECPSSLTMTASGGSLPLDRALKSRVMPGVVQQLLELTPMAEQAKLGLMHSIVRYAEELANQNREANL